MEFNCDTQDPIVLSLEWGPSVNHYWFTHKNYKYISPKGRKFRNSVQTLANATPDHQRLFDKQLSVCIVANPPDARKRDLDNLLKAPLDALQHAGFYKDDNQIVDLRIKRGVKTKQGSLEIVIRGVEYAD
jgi:crossover junction endodeoxyribonuclease RusA